MVVCSTYSNGLPPSLDRVTYPGEGARNHVESVRRCSRPCQLPFPFPFFPFQFPFLFCLSPFPFPSAAVNDCPEDGSAMMGPGDLKIKWTE